MTSERQRFRFSLRTLILFVALAGSGYGLRQSFNRGPWQPGPVLEGHSGQVMSVVYSPDGKRIVTAAGVDSTARLWDAETGHRIVSFPLSASMIDAMSIDTLTSAILFTSPHWPQIMLLCDLETGAIERPLPAPCLVQSWQLTPDNSHIIFHVIEDGAETATAVWVWSVEQKKQTLRIPLRSVPELQTVFYPDDAFLCTYSWDPRKKHPIQTWELSTGKLLAEWQGPPGAIVMWSSDPQRLLVRGNSSMQSWVLDRTSLQPLALLDGFIYQTSPDGKTIQTNITYNDGVGIWRRHRPEQWHGVFYLKEMWATFIFSLAMVWSLRRDWKGLARGGPQESVDA